MIFWPKMTYFYEKTNQDSLTFNRAFLRNNFKISSNSNSVFSNKIKELQATKMDFQTITENLKTRNRRIFPQSSRPKNFSRSSLSKIVSNNWGIRKIKDIQTTFLSKIFRKKFKDLQIRHGSLLIKNIKELQLT